MSIFKRSSNPVPRYYIYISQTKVEMLVPQIPRSYLRSLEAEIKVNVAPVAVGVKKPASAPSPELTAKTNVLSDYLEKKKGWVGTVASPGRYVKGVASLQYGVLRSYFLKEGRLAFFGSGDVDGVKVGLIGSAASLVGTPDTDADADHSLNSYQLMFLGNVAEEDSLEEIAAMVRNHDVAARVLDVVFEVGVLPHQHRLEFLAKPLLHDEGLLVATPIYVAFAD